MSTVVLSPYTVEWSASFSEVREELLVAFAPFKVVVEHIGSTSIPRLLAKPVIDVLLGAGSLSDIVSKIKTLEGLGYVYVAKYERDLPTRRYFVKSKSGSLRVHLHAVESGSRIWREHLAFRDALRADPALVSQYAALKLRLAAEFANDKSAYTAAKAPFIQGVLSVASSESDVG